MAATTRAAIYTRVSSAGQEDNSSLRTQEAECRAYAAEQGWDVVGLYSDVHTGTDLFERPGLSQLREAVRAGGVQIVLAHALDRLSREQTHLGFLFSEWDHAGAWLELATETLDDTPEGRLMLSVHGYAAEVERLKIKERTMRGRRNRIASGKPPVGVRPTYGYLWVEEADKHGKPVKVGLAENPVTAPVVRRIFAEVAAGSSARQVARRLTAEGIPTPTGLAVWAANTITGILRHPTYVGDVTAWRWRHEKVKGRRGYVQSQRPFEDTVLLPDAAPALISREVAAKALQRLDANRQEAVRNNRNPEAALLRGGIVRCGYCGSALQAYNGAWETVYRHNTTGRDRTGCPHFGMKAELLDDAVWGSIRERLTRREVIVAELERLRTQDPTRFDLAALDRRLAEIQRRQRNLMSDLADEDNADLRALIRADVARSIEEQRCLEDERAELERQREGWRLAQERLAELDLWVRNVAANIDEFDYAKKRMALSELGATVRLWATDHTPRWDVKLRPDAFAASFADTTTGACGNL